MCASANRTMIVLVLSTTRYGISGLYQLATPLDFLSRCYLTCVEGESETTTCGTHNNLFSFMERVDGQLICRQKPKFQIVFNLKYNGERNSSDPPPDMNTRIMPSADPVFSCYKHVWPESKKTSMLPRLNLISLKRSRLLVIDLKRRVNGHINFVSSCDFILTPEQRWRENGQKDLKI